MRPYDPPRTARSCLQIGELKCVGWIVLDENNRSGLQLEADTAATQGYFPEDTLLLYPAVEVSLIGAEEEFHICRHNSPA